MTRPAGEVHRAVARHVVYVPVLVAALVMMMVRLLVAARLLPVPEFAAYSAGLLVSGSFCMLGCLGVQTMLQRELPVLIFQERSRRGFLLLMRAMLIACACAAAGTACAAFWPDGGTEHRGPLGAAIFAVGILHGLSQQAFVLVTVESRSRGLTLLFARQYVLRSSLVLGLGTVVMLASGSGTLLLVTEAVVTAVVSLAILRSVADRARMGIGAAARIGLRTMGALRWRSAIALLSVFAVTWIAQNADRWIAERTLDVREFATYAFAVNAIAIASAAQMVANTALFPQLARIFASAGRKAAFRKCASYSAVLTAAGLLVAPLAWVCWNAAVGRWYPAYAASITLAPMIIAVAVFRFADYWSSFLLIVGAETRLLRATMLAVVISVAAWFALVLRAGSPLPSAVHVAWLACITAIVAYVASMVTAWNEARKCNA